MGACGVVARVVILVAAAATAACVDWLAVVDCCCS